MEVRVNENITIFLNKVKKAFNGSVEENEFEKYKRFRASVFEFLEQENVSVFPEDLWVKYDFLINMFGLRKEVIDNFMVTHALMFSNSRDKERLIDIVDQNIYMKPHFRVFQNFRIILSGYFVYVLASSYGSNKPCSARSAQKLVGNVLGLAESTAKQNYKKIDEVIADPYNKSLRLLFDACFFMGVLNWGDDAQNLEIYAPIHKSARTAHEKAVLSYQAYINQSVSMYRESVLKLQEKDYPLLAALMEHPILNELFREEEGYQLVHGFLFTAILLLKEFVPHVLENKEFIKLIDNFYP